MRVLVVASVLMVVTPARADITLEQPAGVCSVDDVRAALRALPHEAIDGSARIATSLHADRVEALLTIGADTRTVTARDCGELASALALIIVMTLREAPRVAPTPIAVVAAVDDTSVEVVVAPVVRARPQLALLVGGAGDVRGRPSLFAGGRARKGRWSVGLEVQAESSQSIDLQGGGRITMSRRYVTAAPCAQLGPLGLCGIATAGALRGRGIELADAIDVTRPVIQLGGRAEWELAITRRLGVRVHVDATQALSNQHFLVDQMPVWTSDSRELRLGVGMVAKVP